MTISTKKLKSFFDSYPFETKLNIEAFDENFCKKLISLIQEDKYNESISAPHLNIFKGLNIGRDELKHCSMLSWFLNPAENHSQYQLFMELFLKELKLNNFLEYIQRGYFSVTTEDSYSKYGRVDISIFNKDFFIIIEAKIDAIEQKNQLFRYSSIIEAKSNQLNIPRSRCKIIYLTLNGKKPKSGSSDINISWVDISKILNTFSNKCKHSYIASTAKQYSEFLKLL